MYYLIIYFRIDLGDIGSVFGNKNKVDVYKPPMQGEHGFNSHSVQVQIIKKSDGVS